MFSKIFAKKLLVLYFFLPGPLDWEILEACETKPLLHFLVINDVKGVPISITWHAAQGRKKIRNNQIFEVSASKFIINFKFETGFSQLDWNQVNMWVHSKSHLALSVYLGWCIPFPWNGTYVTPHGTRNWPQMVGNSETIIVANFSH